VDKEARLQTYAGITALMCAAAVNCQRGIRVLAKHEARMQNDLGQTALMLAAAQNNVESVQLLKTAEAKLQDAGGMTAAMYAAASGSYQSLAALSDEFQISDNEGRSALVHALEAFESLRHVQDAEMLHQYKQNLILCVRLLLPLKSIIPKNK